MVGVEVVLHNRKMGALFSRNLVAAMRLKGRWCILGGAGTGKTETLIRRFCEAVKLRAGDNLGPVLITVDETSRMEVRSRLERLLPSEYMREVVERTRVLTLSDFCILLLRKYALEIGLSPNFEILSDTRQRMALRALASEVIENRRSDIEVSALGERLSSGVLEEVIYQIYRDIREVFPKPSDDNVALPNDPMPFLECFERCYVEVVESADGSDGALDQVIADIKHHAEAAIRAAHRLALGESFDWSDVEELRRFRRRLKAPRNSLSAMAQRIHVARNALDDFLASCLDKLGYSESRALMALVADLHTRYCSLKVGTQTLDQRDILDSTLRLLRGNGGVICGLLELGELILCDVHEADSLEAEIIDELFSSKHVHSAICCRQSYSDRVGLGIEVPVNVRTMRVRQNFRSRKGIVDFVNYLFSKIWAEDGFFEYEPVEYSGSFGVKELPDVEVIFLPEPLTHSSDGGCFAERQEKEAWAVARRIQQMIAGGLLLTSGIRAGKPPKPGDIGVLVRSAAGLDLYERVLGEFGIPVCAVGGQVFCATEEVQQVLLLMKMVVGSVDLEQILDIFTSPFVGVSEATVSALVDNAPCVIGKGDVMCICDELKGLPEVDRKKVLKFLGFVQGLRQVAEILSPAEIIERAVEESGFGLSLLAMRHGERRWANVCRLIDIAREFSSEGGESLQEFISYVEQLERLPSITAARTIQPDGCVEVVQMSRAKGCQWPVVFVADMLWRIELGIDSWIFHPDRGLATCVKNPISGRVEFPLSYLEMKDDFRGRMISREKELFYISVTRAEEYLVLLGSKDLRGRHASTYREAKSWASWVAKAFELGPDSHEGEVERGGCRFSLAWGVDEDKTLVSGRLPTLAFLYPDDIRAGKLVELVSEELADISVAKAIVSRCFEVVPSVIATPRRISVSQMLDYVECPARYWFAHVVGIPESRSELGRDLEEEFSLSELGHVVHDILSKLDFAGDVSEQIDSMLTKVVDTRIRDEAERVLRMFLGTRWVEEMSQSDEVLKELAFETVFEGRVVAGRVDVLFRDVGSDSWTVLDYKTGQAGDDERYGLQVGIYALVTSRLTGVVPSRVVILRLSTGEERVWETADGVVMRVAEERLRQNLWAIESGNFAPRLCKACAWCGLGHLCGIGDN